MNPAKARPAPSRLLTSWYLFESGCGVPADNMAWDEALLLAAAAAAQPVLRFYGWTEAAATFGYFQKFEDVAGMTALRPLLRRPTGGGLVPHDADWTYSLVFPPAHEWYGLRAVSSYRRVHEWIQSAFAALGIRVDLSSGVAKETPGQCFVGAEEFDVVWHGRKLAGAAQRRTRDGLLIQGSIQPPPGLDRAKFAEAFLAEARRQWEVEWHHFEPSGALQAMVASLKAQKYSRPEYHQRR